MNMKQVLAMIVTFMAVLFVGCKDKAEKADNLRLENKFAEAAKLYKQAADEGNAYAKWRLAKAYENGSGVDYDEGVAWSLLIEAHKAGCPQATCDVACAYMYGEYGVEKDVEKGKLMLDELCGKTKDSYSLTRYANEFLYGRTYEKDEEKAFLILDRIKDKNEPTYLMLMAQIYYYGTENIQSDKKKAIEYLEEAYEQGRGSAANIIGLEYLNDNPPLKKDVQKAVEWFEKGIKRNSTESMQHMSYICFSEDSIYNKWHNVERGISLLEKAGRHGDGDAYAYLGFRFDIGEGVYKDVDKAFEYYLKAYKLNSAWGANNLGSCYFGGKGCNKDVEQAVSLWTKASNIGYGKSSENLYRYYYYPVFGGYHHKVDKELAKKYLLLSVKQGDSDGNYDLAHHYYSGSDLFDKDLFEAFAYFKQAADMGNIDACQQVAYMYDNGIGCDRDPDKAKKYRDKTKPRGEERDDNNAR